MLYAYPWLKLFIFSILSLSSYFFLTLSSVLFLCAYVLYMCVTYTTQLIKKNYLKKKQN